MSNLPVDRMVASAALPPYRQTLSESLDPVSVIAQVHNMLVIHPDVPTKTAQEL